MVVGLADSNLEQAVDCIFGAALSLNTLGHKEDSLGTRSQTHTHDGAVLAFLLMQTCRTPQSTVSRHNIYIGCPGVRVQAQPGISGEVPPPLASSPWCALRGGSGAAAVGSNTQPRIAKPLPVSRAWLPRLRGGGLDDLDGDSSPDDVVGALTTTGAGVEEPLSGNEATGDEFALTNGVDASASRSDRRERECVCACLRSYMCVCIFRIICDVV